MKCEITGKEMEQQHTYKTIDKHNISRSIYLKTQLELQKSTITLQDCKAWYKLNNIYKDNIIKIFLYTKKIEKNQDIPRTQVIKDIIQEEQQVSELEYKKYRIALTRKELYNIQNIILSLRDKNILNTIISREEAKGNNDMLYNKYNKNTRYYQDIKLLGLN